MQPEIGNVEYMINIAFLGLGAMGSRMVEALLSENYKMIVWNRSVGKAERVCALGATLAESPREAVADADVIISMVRDDEASKIVWLDEEEGVLQAMKPGALAIECSTLSVDHVRALHNAFEKSSRRFIEAPLAGSRPQAEVKKLIFFAAGNVDDVEHARPLLLGMGAACHYCGTAGAGAAVKLMVNALFGAQLAVIAELIEFARATAVDVRNAIEIISTTPVCSLAASASAKAMLDGQFKPAFPIDLVCKDFNLLALSAKAHQAEIPVSTIVRQTFEKAIEKGFAADNITGIIQLYNKSIPFK